jgi:hypothetical protein
VVNKVRLRMTFENVVKDITQLSDDSWSYRDFVVSILVILTPNIVPFDLFTQFFI